MINIRYHIVSITAVFLALGIGTLLGGTFLDRYTVDLLDRNIRSAEERIAATDAENERLSDDLDAARRRDEDLTALGSAPLYDGRLDGRPVLVVTAPGVDQATIDDLTVALAGAEADLRGVLTVGSRMTFADDIDEGLVERLELTDASPTGVRAEVHSRLHAALVAAGLEPDEPEDEDDQTGEGGETGEGGDTGAGDQTGDPGDQTGAGDDDTGGQAGTGDDAGSEAETDAVDAIESPDGTQPEIVSALLDAGYLELDPADGREGDPILEVPGYAYVFAGGPTLSADDDALLLGVLNHDDPDDITAPVVVVSPTVPADVEDPAPTIVERVRGDAELSVTYATVDNVDTFPGQAATVLLLASGSGAAGHYGEDEGASALLPAGS
ncbi:MAG: copper transporter [Acidimicrobiales bacterium]|nr:copper transporter [Acidimicrobiales bacterium]